MGSARLHRPRLTGRLGHALLGLALIASTLGAQKTPDEPRDIFARTRSLEIPTRKGDSRVVVDLAKREHRAYRNVGRVFVSTADKIALDEAHRASARIRFLSGSCTLLEGGKYVVTAYHITKFQGERRRLLTPEDEKRLALDEARLAQRVSMPFDGPFKIVFGYRDGEAAIEISGRDIAKYIVKHSPHANLSDLANNSGYGLDYAILRLPDKARVGGRVLATPKALVRAGLRGIPPLPRDWSKKRYRSAKFELAGYSGDELGKGGTRMTSDRQRIVTTSVHARRARDFRIVRAYVYPGGSGGALLAKSREKLYWCGLPIAHNEKLATITTVHALYEDFDDLGVLRN